MKKITLTSIITILGMFVFAMPVAAATTASLSPASVNVVAGRSFSVVITANPQGFKNYAEKLEIDYPASNLEVTSFTLGGNWMALTQSNYDSTDNTNGVLIKTAGYPGGFSGATTFGTITFRAKKSGSGTIKIGNSSLAFESNVSKTAITGSGTAFAVSAPEAAAPVNTTEQVTPAVQEPTNTTQTAIQPTSNTQVAATVEAGSPSHAWLWILLIVVVLAVIGWRIFRRRSEPKA